MQVKLVQNSPQAPIDSLLSSVPFYRTVKQLDQYQYDLMMQHSKIIEYRPGERVLEKGQRDEWLYFLLKGQLQVLAGSETGSQTVVNDITPGEVFGDLAGLFNYVRTATVVADTNSKRILVFGMNFNIFGSLEDLHPISLSTKLIFYRNMVHNLRWKLEVYRASYPEQDFASAHRKVKLYCGAKESLEELRSLYFQARELANLLVRWNEEIGRMSLTPRLEVNPCSLQST